MERRVGRRIVPLTLYAFWIAPVSWDVVRGGVRPLLAVAIGVTVAVEILVWGNAARRGRTSAANLSSSPSWSLCFVPTVFVLLLTPEPILSVYKVFTSGLVRGCVFFMYYRVDPPEWVRGVRVE
ncbi:hypothetical protein GRX03_10715 [Halovenus sp. WSH3]|uniref:Uncharacterized protein n=1 Tax=Halovenus carboxidivorans TaxID=2692199 RepID=A0A6B0T1H8_9EURY|nr:hypothetical protein [Halovenus carboxidivorans]MXR52068.1 hypothetical protein [Halovenus carboxidivorans]